MRTVILTAALGTFLGIAALFALAGPGRLRQVDSPAGIAAGGPGHAPAGGLCLLRGSLHDLERQRGKLT